ncbi:MAG: TonB-dependent receptor domain-containing protein [Bryobacteraceae bacterium]
MGKVQKLSLKWLTVLMLAGGSIPAQTTGTATLVGTVTDSTGSVVAGAKVTLTNVQTSFVYESSTTASGDYYIAYINLGTYQLVIESPGFKRYVREGITLRTGEIPRINVALEVGNVVESVTITGAPPLLETETATSGTILEGALVVKIPVMQKFVHRVLLYMPGMNNINGAHAVGQRQRAIGFTLDGISGKEPVVGQVNDFRRSMIASLDSIQEFKLTTTGMPAEVGHSGGGHLSAVFRSGTNEFHGAIEDRYLGGRMLHRHYLEQLRRTGAFDYHEWGATAGGKIKRDKTFFFAGFQQHYETLTETFTGQVPSPQMYQGNFDFGPGSFPIYDPATTRMENGQWVRDPFPGNRIPQSRFDPAVNKLLAGNPWRQQTTDGVFTPAGPTQNLVFEADGKYRFERFDIKIDHQFSSVHKLFGRYSQVRHRSPERPIRQVTDVLYGRVYVQPADFRNIVLSDTYTISPTMVNEARLGFNRRRLTAQPESFGQDWAGRLGIPNVSPETFPDFRNSGGARLYELGPGGRFGEVAEDITFQNNTTKIVGKHTFKGGYEFIRTRYNALAEALPSGQYRMGATDFPFRPNTGNQFASLLLGAVVRADFTMNTATWLPRWSHHAFYFQDSWKALPNLTIEMGMRWSYESPFRTKYGQQSQFDPTAVDPLTGRLGAITHGPGQLASRDLNNFQPRLGLAYHFHPKWVFRGSFGIMTVDLLTNDKNQNFEEYIATAVVQPLPGDPRHAFTLSQGPPSVNFPIAADGSVPFQGTNFTGRHASWFDPNMRMPYIATWSGGLQYEFSRNWLVDLSYEGSAGVRLLNFWDMNQVPLNVSTNLTELNQIFQRVQDHKPWPHFGQIRHFSNYGHNTYHGGTLRVEKRYASGITMNSFYTLSKTINDADNDGQASGVDFYNRRLEKGRANYDIRHRFVGVMTWELPFGKGRRFMSGGGAKNLALGGWDIAWTQTFQSGPPVTIGFDGSPFNYLPGQRRPHQVLPNNQARVPNWDIGPHRFPFAAQNRYFDFDAFRYPDAFTVGSVGRNTIEAPGLSWTQFSFSKEFPIRERMRFSIRWDMNNPFKAPQFANPNSVFNTRNPANFGTFSGTRGSFSDIGTARMHHILVGRFVW